jgi:hypothetical protein
MYRLVISPSPFRATYVYDRTFKWLIAAWWTALWLSMANPYADIDIQKKVA